MTRDGDHAWLLGEILGCNRRRTRDAEAALAEAEVNEFVSSDILQNTRFYDFTAC